MTLIQTSDSVDDGGDVADCDRVDGGFEVGDCFGCYAADGVGDVDANDGEGLWQNWLRELSLNPMTSDQNKWLFLTYELRVP